MSPRRVIPVLLLMLSGANCAGAAEWPERPRLEDYRDYPAFLQAMSRYRQNLALQSVQPPLTITITAPRSETLTELPASAPEMTDWLSEDAPPPLVITGPEDLAAAVEQAKSFVHPVYVTPLRYNRSTSFSFPLGHAPNELLAASAAATALLGLGDEPKPGGAWLDSLTYEEALLSQASAGSSAGRWLEPSRNSVTEVRPVLPIQMQYGLGRELSGGTFESFPR